MDVGARNVDGEDSIPQGGRQAGTLSCHSTLQDQVVSEELSVFMPDISTLSLESHQTDRHAPAPRAKTPCNSEGLDQVTAPGQVDVLGRPTSDPSGAQDEHCKKNDLRLPPELWLRIIGLVASTDQQTQADVATVCSLFQSAVEENLYRYPELRNIRALQTFTSAIRASPDRAGLVRGLRLGCPDGQTTPYISAVNNILPELPLLHTLDLSGFGDVCVPEPVAVNLLEDPNGSKYLSLRRIRGLRLYLSPRLMSILKTLPNLVELPAHAYASLPDPDIEDEDDFELLDIPRKLPRLCTLSCPYSMLDGVTTPGNITSLCLSKVCRKEMDEVASLFGPQLVNLRVERKLRPAGYAGMAYPTNWNCWLQFPRLRFLDIQDFGKRCRDLKTETIKVENLPPSLEILIWDPTWIADCALHDSRTEEWRRTQIRSFAETVLRDSSGLRTVVYRWRRDVSYQCALVGGREGRFCEFLADPLVQDPYAWADYRC